MKTTKQNYISKTSDFDAYEADITMSNNLMLRSMFFMNDEARHFLAPPLPLPPCESEYFQKKSLASSSSNVSQSSGVSSQLQDGSTEKPAIVIPKQRPHSCDECGKTFLMKHHLTTHMRVHTGERPHVCPECGKSFALKHCLSTHLLLHTSDRPYKCHECSKTFTLKHHLVSHERVHSREQPFECPECGRRFPQKRHLTTHIKFHSGERPFVCEVCDESFSREEHLVMHSRFHGGQRPFICPDCGAGFLRKFELVNHERQHGRNPEACPVCGKEFLQKRTLLVHVRTCGLPLQNLTAPATQSLSPPRYTSNDNSAVSSKTCKECGETFASVEGLALHLRLHFGDHSFLSDICSLAASLKQSAVNAALTLSFATKKTHLCSDCGRGFAKKHGLFTHKQRHENGSCKLKPYACDKCGKSFAQKNHLSLHERQHMDLPNQRSSKSESSLWQSQTNKDDSVKRRKSEDTIEDHDDLSQESKERLMEENQSLHVLNNERKNSVMQVQSQSDLAQRHNLCSQRNEKDSHINQNNTHESLNQSEESLVNQHQSCEAITGADLQQCSSNDSFTQAGEIEQNDDLTIQPVERYLKHHTNERGGHINQRNAHESLNHQSKDGLINRRHSCESITHADIQQCSSNDSFTQEDKMEQHDLLTVQPAERYLNQQNRHSNNGLLSSTLSHQNSTLRNHCDTTNLASGHLSGQRRSIPLSRVYNSIDNRLSISLSQQSNHSEAMETQDLLNHNHHHQHHMDPSPPTETPVGSSSSFQHGSTGKHQY